MKTTQFKEKYGQYALVAGGSDGLGLAFAEAIARRRVCPEGSRFAVLSQDWTGHYEELFGTLGVVERAPAAPLFPLPLPLVSPTPGSLLGERLGPNPLGRLPPLQVSVAL
jgi:hypothetical protein